MNQEPKNGTELLARFFGNKSIVDTTIEQIPIESLLDNPANFYGLRDIDYLWTSEKSGLAETSKRGHR